jgi:nitrate reductase NapE component
MNYSTIVAPDVLHPDDPKRPGRRDLCVLRQTRAAGNWASKTKDIPPVGERALKTLAWIVSLLCLAPILAVAFAAASGTLTPGTA